MYPAIKSRVPWWWDYFLGTEPNPLGCWDWWGYLDPGTGGDRYLTKDAPQIKVIEGIIVELTKPLPVTHAMRMQRVAAVVNPVTVVS